jgi:phosphatidylserine/phosphatidylglycerophosphate/cardiolipin synthase-like enzyme
MTELGEIVMRRLDAGVEVALLTRRVHRGENSVLRLAQHPKFAAYEWYEPPALGQAEVVTFHAKMVVADDGHRAYMGSANMTESSLRSRYELGVFLEGEASRTLYRAVATILETLARRVPQNQA